MEHFPAPRERAASDAFAERLRAEIAQRGRFFWAVELREEAGSFVGFTGLRVPMAQLPIGPCVEIVSFTALPNLRSQAVMRRIGMRHDGEVFEHPNVAAGHRLRPHCLYRMRCEDWEAHARSR